MYTTINQIYNQAIENAKANGNNVIYEIDRIAKFLDYDEITEISSTMNHRTVSRLVEKGLNPERRDLAVDIISGTAQAMLHTNGRDPREFVKW